MSRPARTAPPRSASARSSSCRDPPPTRSPSTGGRRSASTASPPRSCPRAPSRPSSRIRAARSSSTAAGSTLRPTSTRASTSRARPASPSTSAAERWSVPVDQPPVSASTVQDAGSAEAPPAGDGRIPVTSPAPTTGDVDEDPLAAGRVEGVDLVLVRLLGARDADVSDERGHASSLMRCLPLRAPPRHATTDGRRSGARPSRSCVDQLASSDCGDAVSFFSCRRSICSLASALLRSAGISSPACVASESR